MPSVKVYISTPTRWSCSTCGGHKEFTILGVSEPSGWGLRWRGRIPFTSTGKRCGGETLHIFLVKEGVIPSFMEIEVVPVDRYRLYNEAALQAAASITHPPEDIGRVRRRVEDTLRKTSEEKILTVAWLLGVRLD